MASRRRTPSHNVFTPGSGADRDAVQPEKVTSVDWRTYRTFPVGFDIPRLETVLIDTMDAEANGAGETSITVTAAAIGNAIFDATGLRMRQVPFTPERVKAASGAN